MIPQASDDESPSRAALEEPLTLNKRQSWFGSFRNAVHRGAVSAKAAVESLRGSPGDITSAADPDKSDVPPTERRTSDKQSGCDGTSTSKSAVASLRQNLSRHSRLSGRGSVSHVFRRSGSNASSLRGPRDPDAVIRNSQDISKGTSPLARDGKASKNPALVPLPSSPINIPPPVPTLRLDLGPPAMLSPFTMTSSELAEIKVLQDPTNITTGVPPSCPLDWRNGPLPGQLRRGAFDAGVGSPSLKGKHLSAEHHYSELLEDPSSEHDKAIESAISALTIDPPRLQMLRSQLESHHPQSLSDLATPMTERDDPFQAPPFSQRASNVPVAMIDEKAKGVAKQSPDYTETAAFNVAGVSSPETSHVTARNSLTPIDATCQTEFDDAIDPFQLPSPLLAIKRPSSQHIIDATNRVGHTEPTARLSGGRKVPANAETIRAQQKYRDSFAGLEESPAIEKLEPAIIQHVEQNPFVGGPGIPGPALKRSDSLVPVADPEENDFEMPQIPDKVKSTPDAVTLNPIQRPNEKRRDSLFADTKHEPVYEHGPPSPERTVRLPLRPKATLTKHTSFESTIFKPILDRVAAKNLGVFRPGSDPLLRQKYFPGIIVDSNSPVEHPRQSSLDSNDTLSTETESGDDTGIFERTVEQPSPLHIRKQSSTMNVHTGPSPQTPEGTSTSEAPGSSPTRTPSMGDKQQFDLQRAERNARYVAIHAGGSGTAKNDDLDIQLAEFGNAGPGSRSSTPKRNSGGRVCDQRETPSPLERALGKAYNPSLACPVGRRPFMALSKD